jgi:glycosyltransferase involved in cell wall biosynthesis
VIHVIAPGPIAGAEKVVLHGARALAERGHEIELVAVEETRAPDHARAFVDAAHALRVRARTVLARGPIDLGLVRALRDTSNGADVMHVHGHKALAHALAGVPSDRVVCTWHGSTAHDARVRVYEGLALRLAARCARVIAVGEPLVSGLERAGIPRERIAVVENPVALGEVAAPRARPGALRLLFAGRISSEKGLDVLLDALARPEAQGITLDVAGDGPERASLAERAAALGGRVRFLGWVPSIAGALGEVDALALPSRREGLPLAVLEAAAGGRAIVASDVGAVREVVVPGENGLLVSPGDPAALARALASARDRLALFLQHAARRAPLVRARFGTGRWAQRTEEIYAGVGSEHARRLAGLR